MPDPATTIGRFLRDARERRNFSLRSVEESTGISNAYLSQIEHGKIRQPSPVVLHKLSVLYGVSYSETMRLAGYPMPDGAGAGQATGVRAPLARFGDITTEEETALTEYLEFLRARRKKGTR